MYFTNKLTGQPGSFLGASEGPKGPRGTEGASEGLREPDKDEIWVHLYRRRPQNTAGEHDWGTRLGNESTWGLAKLILGNYMLVLMMCDGRRNQGNPGGARKS